MKKKDKVCLLIALMAAVAVGCGKGSSQTEETAAATETVTEASETEEAAAPSEADEEADMEAAPENTVTKESQQIEAAGIDNARELGGYYTLDGRIVKRGLLLRTAELGTGTEEELVQMAEKYHLAHVIDMRTDAEKKKSPESEIPSVQTHEVKIMNDEIMMKRLAPFMDEIKNPETDTVRKLQICLDSGVVSDQMYVEFLQDDTGKAGYREFFRILLENEKDKAVLWHCTNGKDRTGVGAMLLLFALDVDEETIMKDYLLTNDFFADEIGAVKSRLETEVKDEKVLEDMLVASRGVSRRYMENAVSYIKKVSGSPREYLRQELGLTDGDIEKLKELYTEPQ